MFILAIILYFILPPQVLERVGWHWAGSYYGTDGPDYQKIHIATYLLIATFICLWLIDPRFRRNVTDICCTNWSLIMFALALGATASYAILVKGVSITPFIDTFIAALVVAIGCICLPPKKLRFLRNLLDIYFVTNIAIIFLEYAIRWSLFPSPIGEGFETLQPWRASGFFGNGIAAGNILAVYSIVNFALSMPFNFTRQCLTRLTLAFVSFLAIFTTGSRAAAGVTILILFAFMAISAVRQIASGRINRAAVIYGFFGLAVVPICLMVLLQLGLFDTVLERIADDQGSAMSRAIALDIVSNTPTDKLWLGLSTGDLRALALRQQELNLIAIEISWVNFLLSSGMVFTVPLFAAYSLFLFRFLPRYCGPPAILISILVLIITATNNGIWAKTTVLTMSFAITLAFFRNTFVTRQLG
jgi:hypothetical protein